MGANQKGNRNGTWSQGKNLKSCRLPGRIETIDGVGTEDADTIESVGEQPDAIQIRKEKIMPRFRRVSNLHRKHCGKDGFQEEINMTYEQFFKKQAVKTVVWF